MCVSSSKSREQLSMPGHHLDKASIHAPRWVHTIWKYSLLHRFASQMPQNWQGRRVEGSHLLVESKGTGLPQTQGRTQSSGCGQVTESPHSPRHLEAQGHRQMCHIFKLKQVWFNIQVKKAKTNNHYVNIKLVKIFKFHIFLTLCWTYCT